MRQRGGERERERERRERERERERERVSEREKERERKREERERKCVWETDRHRDTERDRDRERQRETDGKGGREGVEGGILYIIKNLGYRGFHSDLSPASFLTSFWFDLHMVLLTGGPHDNLLHCTLMKEPRWATLNIFLLSWISSYWFSAWQQNIHSGTLCVLPHLSAKYHVPHLRTFSHSCKT